MGQSRGWAVCMHAKRDPWRKGPHGSPDHRLTTPKGAGRDTQRGWCSERPGYLG
ncbi:unnamed protein product [Gulo gulo]|uniref:Uncharacterized protein n=1 Tax=Gulo gulo TaxID=48420 RepID=A0A9X9LP09_GULGU|nr:unnamed protein product [Gulo gulo]